MKIGYFLSSEEWGPRDLISQAVKAQEAGFEGLWISDHYHPWNDAQGHSGFVWGTIGAIATAAPGMHVTTAVTCPTMRIHPAVIAQAAATAAVLLDGQFALGVGSGEALNEHIFGDAWPNADERLEMLEESIEVIRTLWQAARRTTAAVTTASSTPVSTTSRPRRRRSSSPRSGPRRSRSPGGSRTACAP
jgi:G6PDH family F420-dependent oxidoreductase